MPQSFAVPAATRAQLLAQAGDAAVVVAAPVKGTPFTLLSLAGVGTARPVLAAHLPSLQGGLKVLLGHLFPCHQEAPGHLGVLEDQGDQWLHLDLDHPGRSSHRHGEMKRRRQAVVTRLPATHAPHPWAIGTLASAVPEEFNYSFQLGRLEASSWPIHALWVWSLNEDFAQCLPTRFYLIKPCPATLRGNHQFDSTQK